MKDVLLEWHYLFSLGHQVNELPYHILKVFVASVEVHHPLDDPLIFDFIIKIAVKDSVEKGSRIFVKDSSIAILNARLSILKNYQRLNLPHNNL